ncbi:hypothetical protein LOZ66_003835 [Ophidiomyces ophidiicola]|nr:hypothetical protein LOZ66_003835 [Ophidiomyces ophidiicola]
MRRCRSVGDLQSSNRSDVSISFSSINPDIRPYSRSSSKHCIQTRLSETLISPFLFGDQVSPRKVPSYFDRRRGHISPVLQKHGRLSSPDRFVSSNGPQSPPEVQYHVSKPCDLLSPYEKAHRMRDPNADAFSLPISARVVTSAARQTTDRRLIPYQRPRHIVNQTFPGDPFRTSRDEPGESEDDIEQGHREVSVGAVWLVGGVSQAFSNSRSRLDHSRSTIQTAAPWYPAKFSRKETDAEQHRMHETRVALALDLDPAARILEVSVPQSPPSTPSKPTSPIESCSLHGWKDGEWMRSDGRLFSKKFLSTFISAMLYLRAHQAKINVESRYNLTQKTDQLLSILPFRVLDAPFLRDDFYSKILAYCYKTHVLAVGLSLRVYLWSEQHGMKIPPLKTAIRNNFVTSLSFSSEKGGRSILAVGRRYGQLSLWSSFDIDVRFQETFPIGVACVTFKDEPTTHPSEFFPEVSVYIEHLAVGDDGGNIWYYTLEWTSPRVRKRHGWNGSLTLVAKIAAHKQQVCGLSWSPDGKFLASGGNDNVCLVYDTSNIVTEDQLPNSPHLAVADSNIRGHLQQFTPLHHSNHSTLSLPADYQSRDDAEAEDQASESSLAQTVVITRNRERCRLKHRAAVKAIAFAPWEPALLATGGGSSDQCIRFWHAPTGCLLATIRVYAQVTSLIWSKTRREIAATFGYPQPHHPYRIAVFTWPECEQVLAIPWAVAEDSRGVDDDVPGRAICAITYPGSSEVPIYNRSPTSLVPAGASQTSGVVAHGRSPHIEGASPGGEGDTLSTRMVNSQDGPSPSRTALEGCIVIAGSDESIRFHEVWRGGAKGLGGCTGLFGGSQILESLHGLDTNLDLKETIR